MGSFESVKYTEMFDLYEFNGEYMCEYLGGAVGWHTAPALLSDERHRSFAFVP